MQGLRQVFSSCMLTQDKVSFTGGSGNGISSAATRYLPSQHADGCSRPVTIHGYVLCHWSTIVIHGEYILSMDDTVIHE